MSEFLPFYDAAPSDNGAGVNKQNLHADRIAHLSMVPPVRHDAPDTSRNAAHKIAGHAATLRIKVLNFLRACGDQGATDQEIQIALDLPSNTEIPRRWELVNAGTVVASGKKRKTTSNCLATVWLLSEFAPKPEGGAA